MSPADANANLPSPPADEPVRLPRLKRPPWLIQQHVLGALVVREVKSRFGHNLTGYFWSVLEPMLQIVVLWVVFTNLGRKGIQGVELPLFLMTGIFNWYMFRKIIARIANSIGPNIGLFSYHHVKVFDVIIVRMWIETLIFMGAMAMLLMFFSYLGFDTSIHDPMLMILVYLLFVLFSLAIGMLNLIVTTFYPVTGKFTSLIFRVLFFVSCIFYSLQEIPGEIQPYFVWNPLVQFLELLRVSYFPYYATSPLIRLDIVFFITLISLYGAMALYRVNRTRLIQFNLINRQGG